MEYQSGAVAPVGSIEEGWSFIKDDYWTFFLMSLLSFVMLAAVAVVVGLINNLITLGISTAFGAATHDAGDAGKISAAFVPQIVSMFVSFFTGIIITTLAGTLACGFYTALSRKVNTGVADFSDLFGGFNYWQSCLTASVVLSAIQFIINVVILMIGLVLGISAFGAGILGQNGKLNPNLLGAIFGFGLLIAFFYILLMLLLAVATAFVFPLIAERGLSGIQALALSARGGLSNALGLIGFFILQSLLVLGGFLLCGVGILFVAPLMYASVFAAYRQVFGVTNSNFNPPMPPPPPPIFHH